MKITGPRLIDTTFVIQGYDVNEIISFDKKTSNYKISQKGKSILGLKKNAQCQICSMNIENRPLYPRELGNKIDFDTLITQTITITCICK